MALRSLSLNYTKSTQIIFKNFKVCFQQKIYSCDVSHSQIATCPVNFSVLSKSIKHSMLDFD
jgi:hypothetical protein